MPLLSRPKAPYVPPAHGPAAPFVPPVPASVPHNAPVPTAALYVPPDETHSEHVGPISTPGSYAPPVHAEETDIESPQPPGLRRPSELFQTSYLPTIRTPPAYGPFEEATAQPQEENEESKIPPRENEVPPSDSVSENEDKGENYDNDDGSEVSVNETMIFSKVFSLNKIF
ncbi:hypothetical protein KIN20_024574 [Parelaphostrongylus tenuis]|uniref:Uncharacterized protein n=1 Tax=Parelaphostrongylus tenuis TaxID=148309 RepID=A0AAD5MTR4_PARTN|nr:hypothetical protein KIN20_024574 [Parelaphostrongylus tenuis]